MKGTVNKVKTLLELSRFDLPRFFRWVLVLIIYLITFSALGQLSQTLQLFPGVVAWYLPDGDTVVLADKLGITGSTLRNLLSGAYLRLGVRTRAAAIAKAQQLGILPVLPGTDTNLEKKIKKPQPRPSRRRK